MERLLQHIALPDGHIPRLEIHSLLADFYAGPDGPFQLRREMPDEFAISTAEVEALDYVRSHESPQRPHNSCETFCGQRAICEGFGPDDAQLVVW